MIPLTFVDRFKKQVHSGLNVSRICICVRLFVHTENSAQIPQQGKTQPSAWDCPSGKSLIWL